MGNHQKSVEIHDQETGEVIDLSVGGLASEIRDMLLSRRRKDIQATIWSKLSEDQQRDEIEACTSLADDVIAAVVDVVASAGHDVVHAKLDNFKIKDGAVTITAKGSADDGAVLALNHVGHKNLKIIVADVERFEQNRTDVEADPDQPEMFPEDGACEQGAEHLSDEQLYQAAVNIVLTDRKCSTSYIQRKLAIAYNKAARLIERMEEEGVASPADHLGKREILEQESGPDDDQVDGDQEPDLTGEEVDEIAAEMDQDADDLDRELDQDDGTEDHEDLDQASGEMDEDELIAHQSRLKSEGSDAKLKGQGVDDCPYDGGTTEYHHWRIGYDETGSKISELINQGREAAISGSLPDVCPWNEQPRVYWMKGYNDAKAEMEASSSDPENDSFNQGALAAQGGVSLEDNPYPEDTVKNGMWADGWASAD